MTIPLVSLNVQYFSVNITPHLSPIISLANNTPPSKEITKSARLYSAKKLAIVLMLLPKYLPVVK
ncbi:MAG: hypothetical protein H6Q68_1688 [Firmicutes bacterium]|nr:hypothetical protein [Bacillota bacterium]